MATEAGAQVVQSLFVTLRRGFAGTPWQHRRILEALGLKRRHQCLEKPNNSMIRGMLSKVPHMVIVETDRMFYLRSMRTYHEQLPRTPITALHDASLPSAEASAPTRYAQQHLTEHLLLPAQLGWKKLWQKQPPTQYAKEFAVRQRVKTLTEQGLFSQAAIREHQARVAAKHKGR